MENNQYPVLCTRGVLIYPNQTLTIDVGRAFSLNALKRSEEEHESLIVVVSQINRYDDDVNFDSIYHTGVLCRIQKMALRDSEGTMHVTLFGMKRCKINTFDHDHSFYFGEVELLDDQLSEEGIAEQLLVQDIKDEVKNSPQAAAILPPNFMSKLAIEQTPGEFSDMVAQSIIAPIERKQKLIEELSVEERLIQLLVGFKREKTINEIENSINNRVRKAVDNNQKEFYLREKMKAIKEELGDVPDGVDDIAQIREKLENNPYPENIKNKIKEELARYEMMSTSSPEANVVRNYIDWVMKTPWWQETIDNEDLSEVERRLDEDHFGLKKPKERIVEYLAVKQMTQSLKAPIICLVGPPGVGKTSIAKSVARALDRKFVKASLGGVTDESEIRGHRRTYLGSMPGRIIQSMKKVGVVNPVFLLDEIDKMASDYKGDPTSAMLEVLDPEQNEMFSDNYIEESYDLSKVLFIATANDLGGIPGPLRDRLEIIEISSYTEQEKVMIAKNHLIKKQAKANGLKDQLKIDEEAILKVIQHYTREAGVRQLERYIASICRKAVLKVLKDKVNEVHVTTENLEEFLGKPIFDHTKQLRKPTVGVVTGLAWTQFGGDILPIEVNHFKGSGKFNVTGQLGDVMKESASIALDYMKANSEKYHLTQVDFDKQDIHIHVPEGAVKKDGPSAGVTLTTALYSAFTGKAVKNNVAMTGEITLSGDVLPIGGLREKAISARRSGIDTIIIPKDNAKDIEDIPESVQKELNIILADHIDTVLQNAIVE